jgi:hypothetical protein
MTTNQPIWKLAGTVGDVNPIDYSGGFIYTDETGVYPPELEWIESEDEHKAEPTNWTVYRILLERCAMVKIDGAFRLITGTYESSWPKPIEEYIEWFDESIKNVSDSSGISIADLESMLCSTNAQELAQAYLTLAQYHGWENFDGYPLKFTDREELATRYQTKHKGNDNAKQ